MKKIFSFVAAALMSVSLFAEPATVPTVQDLASAGYDVTGMRVIALYFDEQVCNDIVWAGSYNGWKTTPADMAKFETLEGFDGWYVIELDDAREPQAGYKEDGFDIGAKCCVGKPVQLKKDGSFDWEFQAGDKDAWNDMAQPGTNQHHIYGGYAGEADICWNEYGAYIYEVAYFKTHNSPCGEDKPKHDYTINAYLPEFCDAIVAYADSVRLMGGFDGWNNDNYVWMTKTFDEDFNLYYTATINDVEEGTAFKLRFGTDEKWAVQVQLDGKNLDNMMTGETTTIVLQFDGKGYGFAACTEYKYTEYENWQLKHEGSSWEWTENLEKVEEGLFILADANWTGSGFNVGSDENPIKKDYFAPEELTIGEEVIAPVIVDVYLKIVDDETVAIGVGVIPSDPSALKHVKAVKASKAIMKDGQIFFQAGEKVYNVLGAEMK